MPEGLEEPFPVKKHAIMKPVFDAVRILCHSVPSSITSTVVPMLTLSSTAADVPAALRRLTVLPVDAVTVA